MLKLGRRILKLVENVMSLLGKTEARKIVHMAGHFPRKPPPPKRARGSFRPEFEMTHRISIKERDESDFLRLIAKLTSHLERDQTPERPSAEKIRALRLHLTHFTDVVSGHVVDASQRLLPPIDPPRLKGIEGLLRIEMSRQLLKLNDIPARGMNTKEWSLRSVRLNGHK